MVCFIYSFIFISPTAPNLSLYLWELLVRIQIMDSMDVVTKMPINTLVIVSLVTSY